MLHRGSSKYGFATVEAVLYVEERSCTGYKCFSEDELQG